MYKRIYILFGFLLMRFLSIGQSPVPTTTVFTSPLPNQAVDSYTRASVKINLTAGFKYGFVTGGATNLQNLNISTNPVFVPTGYLGSGVNPQANGCANNGNFDSDKPVGETAGNFMVSPSGAAIYNIPIIISPGTKGIQPQLNINYNSQGGVGLLGTAWMLSGLSSITRSEKTPIQDGKNGGVELSTNDVFKFDGNRLFSLVGPYGQSGSTYYTESESFATITSSGLLGNGPQSFQVIDKNGNILEFGNSVDSRLVGIGNNTPLSWYLNKMTDEFGNYMLYKYIQLNGEMVIDKIEYTGNASAGLSPYNTVKFDYIQLAEKTSYFVAGVEFKKTQLLKTITSYSGSDLVRKYILDYDWSNGTYLASIKEIDSDCNELNPTVFCWSDPSDFGGTKNFQSTKIFTNTGDYTDLNPVAADLNGDGFSDYVCVYPQSGRIRIMRNDFKTNYGTNNSDIQFNQVSDNLFQVPVNSKLLSANVTDNNLDNNQEVYTIFGNQNPGNYNTYTILKTELNPNTSITSIGNFVTPGTYNPNFEPGQFYYDTKDYNGDGINDILRIDPYSINLTTPLGIVNYAIASPSAIVRPFSFNNDGISEYIVIDNFNPSVVSVKIISLSVVGVNQSLIQIYTNNYNFPANIGGGARNLLKNFGIGDFNGDGIGDLTYINETFTGMFICTGSGAGFIAPKPINSFTPLQNNPLIEYDLNVVDINSDGKSDFTINDNVVQANNSPVNNYFTYFSVGDLIIKGGSYSGNWTYNNITVWYNEPIEYEGVTYTGGWDIPVTVLTGYKFNADLNGDGIYDVTSFNSPTQDRTIANNINGVTRLSIQSILTPMKKRLDIRYANINSEIYVQTGGVKNEIYRKQSLNTYNTPLYNFKPSIYCVNSTKELSGYNYQILKEKKYVYSDAIFNDKGRGFLGFEQVMTFDRFSKIGTVSKSSFNTTYNIALNSEVVDAKIISSIDVLGITRYNVDNTKLIAKLLNSTSIIPRYTKGYFVSLNQTIYKDYINSSQTTSNLVYNLSNNGNISNKTTIYGWTGQPVVKTLQSNYTYILSNGYFKIQNETNTQTQTGESSYVRNTNYYYDPQGHLSSIVNDPTFGAQSLITSFSQFNSFGHPTKTSISAGDVSNRDEDVVYETTGRFEIKRTNSISNFAEFVYDSKYGNVTQSKDISGLVTQYFYDGLGRRIKSILPNGSINKITYAWDDPGNSYTYSPIRVGVYSINMEIEGQSYAKTYYIENGLPIRRESLDFSGQIIVSDTKYNLGTNFTYPSGEILESTEPHYLSQAKYLIKKFDYETIFYRPSTETTYSLNGGSPTNTGILNQTSYNNPSTDIVYNQAFVFSTNQNNQQMTKETNAAGQLIKIQNTYPGLQENTLYSYNSNGNPKTITLTNNINPGQNIVHGFNYNNLGQRVQMNDPSAGIISFQYNTLGELMQRSDPNCTYNYTYDNLGRITTKIGNLSGTTSYQYISNGNGKELVSKIIGPNSTTDLKYDNLNRLVEYKETIGSKIFKSNYSLDKYGREIQHTYPSGFISKSVYNSLGYLTNILDNNNQNIWQLTSQDALQRITEYSYGNGITTKNKFDDLNYLSEINHGNGSIHKQTYTHNQFTGNITSRIFSNYLSNVTLKETFNFDVVDRLTQAKQIDPISNNQLQVNNTTFDILGNITHKDDAGDLAYTNSNKPFNLTQINNPSNNINPNTLSVLYNDFKKVGQIKESVTNKQMDFIYGTDEERIKVDYSINGINQYTRYYAENFDRQETGLGFKEWNYVFAPTGLCAIYFNNNGIGQLLYVLSDHIKTPILLTNQSQQIVEDYAYDAWGRKRNPTNWTYSGILPSQYMIRGFTMHEQIDEFALVNMNGRIYDPVIGRFIQPDNFIQSPEFLQNFNRYSYVFNNPLKFTDPSGNVAIIDDILAAAIGGVFNVVSNWNNIHNFGQAAAYFGIGAVGGWVGLYTFGAGGGALIALGNGLMQGASAQQIGQNMVIGAIGGAIGFGIGAGLGSVDYGIANISNDFARYAAKAGVSFGVGFVSGFAGSAGAQAFSAGFGWQQGIDLKSAAKAGLIAGGTSAAISIGFSIYDYNSWDKYSQQEKIAKLNKSTGKKYWYAKKEDYEAIKLDAMNKGVDVSDWRAYNELYGITIGDRTFIFDNGLTSEAVGQITYAHEGSHRADNKLGLPRNEEKAFQIESSQYNSSIPARYIDTRSGYMPTFSNRFFNIWR